VTLVAPEPVLEMKPRLYEARPETLAVPLLPRLRKVEVNFVRGEAHQLDTDVREFVDDLRDLHVTPHIAQNTTNRTSAVDARTTRHRGYAISQQKRKRTEEPFGWGKTIGGLARPMLRGVARLRFKFTLTMAAYDLIRLPKLLEASA
jgi:Transposase DDE domain